MALLNTNASSPVYTPASRNGRGRPASWLRVSRPIILPIVTAAAILGIWEALVGIMGIPEMILPAPSVIAERIWEGRALLAAHSVPTTIEALLGFVMAIVLGTVLAALVNYSEIFSEAVSPNIVALQVVPKIALAPLFVVWFGIGSEARLAFITFVCFFPVMIATSTGLKCAPADTVRLAKSLMASRWQIFLSIRIPYAAPYVFSGIKIAATLSIISVVVSEFINSQRGLGYLILFASSKADTALIFAALAFLCVTGVTLFGVVAAIEKLVRNRLSLE